MRVNALLLLIATQTSALMVTFLSYHIMDVLADKRQDGERRHLQSQCIVDDFLQTRLNPSSAHLLTVSQWHSVFCWAFCNKKKQQKLLWGKGFSGCDSCSAPRPNFPVEIHCALRKDVSVVAVIGKMPFTLYVSVSRVELALRIFAIMQVQFAGKTSLISNFFNVLFLPMISARPASGLS